MSVHVLTITVDYINDNIITIILKPFPLICDLLCKNQAHGINDFLKANQNHGKNQD